VIQFNPLKQIDIYNITDQFFWAKNFKIYFNRE